MRQSDVEMVRRIASAVRALSIDAIEKQQSGHPGMPLGFADVGAYLFAHVRTGSRPLQPRNRTSKPIKKLEAEDVHRYAGNARGGGICRPKSPAE